MAISIPILLIITILGTAGAVTVGVQTGAFNFLGIGPNDNNVPLINGTIVNYDNKTYGILIVPSNGTVTVPPPVTNDTVPLPPPINNTGDNDTIPNPPPVNNTAPTFEVDSPIKCIVNSDCTMTTENIKDADGQVTAIIWNQESGPTVTFTPSPDKWTATFKPSVGGTYVFSVEVQDDDGATTLKAITVNVPTVTPTPAPTTGTVKILLVGDVDNGDSGKKVFAGVKARNANNTVVLGDLGYDDNLAWFKSTYGTLGNKLNCVIGNHDSPEDGNSAIYTEAKQYCSESYYFKKNNVLFFGINTNGDLAKQQAGVTTLLKNTQFMTGIKSVHLMSHKGCVTPPNSHHPASESSGVVNMCNAIKAAVPAGVTFYGDSAHNHVLSQSADLKYKQSGAGGRSHYSCGTSTAFPWCNNVNYGFLEYTIKPDGTTTHQFVDYNGKVLK